MLCTIRRDKSGFNRWYPKYELFLSVSLLLIIGNYAVSGDWEEESSQPHFELSDHYRDQEVKEEAARDIRQATV